MKRLALPAGLIGLTLVALFGLLTYLLRGQAVAARTAMLVLALPLLGASLFVGRRQVLDVLRGRRLRIGAQSAVYTLAVAVALLLVNFVAARHRYRADLTQSQIWSLTPVSERVLARVDEPVELIGFFAAAQKPEARAARAVYRLYAQASPLVSHRVVDPLREPDVAARYGVSGSGVTLAVCGDRVRIREGYSQTAITNLIASVTGGHRTALFLRGRGMRGMGDPGPNGYAQLARVLGDALFEVSTHVFTPGERIDPQVSLVIVPGPEEPLADFEVDLLHDYLLAGGHVLVFADPFAPGTASPVLGLAARWGLDPLPGVVAQVNDAETPWQVYATRFSDAQAVLEVARGMDGRRIVFDRPGAIAVAGTDDPRRFAGHLLPLDAAADRAFIVPEVRRGRPNPDAATLPFPENREVGLISFAYRGVLREGRAVAVSRLLLVGDADFADNFNISQEDNRRLVSALVGWLTGEDLVVEEESGGSRRVVAWGSHRRAIAAVLAVPPIAVLLVGSVVLGWRRWR